MIPDKYTNPLEQPEFYEVRKGEENNYPPIVPSYPSQNFNFPSQF